jgi:hypothetical protein
LTKAVPAKASAAQRTLAAVGTFGVVPEDELDVSRGAVDHLRDEGLVETVDLGDDKRGLILTKEGRDLLDSHTMERDGEAPQASHPPRVGAAACGSERPDEGAVAPRQGDPAKARPAR